ncbi:TPA: hypothetical protein JLC96_001678 [Escherichia coli]|nr:hypothetical protein [Escherichia coli]
MTTITKERIELFIKNPLENGLTRGEQMELARIALASLEAEPVAWLYSDNGLGIPAITRSKNIADSWLSNGWYVQPLYIAQPVPVIPDEVLSAIREVARVRADFDDFDGDRRGIGDCLDEAEQELIVTINKYASQLAVEPVVPDDVLEQTVASPAPGNQVSELTMWVKRLAHSLKYANSLSSLPDKAMEYLNQNGLISVEDVLR